MNEEEVQPTNQPWLRYASAAEWQAKLPRPGQRVEGTPDGSYSGLVGLVWFVESDQPGFFTLARAIALQDGTRHAELSTYAASDIRRVSTDVDPAAVSWLLAEIRRLQGIMRKRREKASAATATPTSENP